MVAETTITKNILKLLNSFPQCKAIKLHTGMYGKRGTPDILCVCRRRVIFIEVKKPGGTLKQIQLVELEDWRKAGAISIITDNAKDIAVFMERLQGKLDTLTD